MDYLLASHNLKKREEMERILSPLGIRVLTAEQAGVNLTDAEETGKTFEENAYIKAKAGADETSMPCIADDSGLSVDALNGEPGVYSARYSGEHGNDEKNIDLLLEKLKDVPMEKRTARFVCSICICYPSGETVTAKGECEGRIAFERHGNSGFGYDPVFIVGNKSFAQMSKEEKDKISHRGTALNSLVKKLAERK